MEYVKHVRQLRASPPALAARIEREKRSNNSVKIKMSNDDIVNMY